MNEQSSIDKLEKTVRSIDCQSQSAFSDIASLAKVALAYMENPACYQFPENIARIFNRIWCIAEMTQNSINCEAEELCCHYEDPELMRRYDARNAAEAQANEVLRERWARMRTQADRG